MDDKVGTGQNQSPKTFLVGSFGTGYLAYRSSVMVRSNYWVHSGQPVGSFATGQAYARPKR
jgi:hypothetical protein